MPTPPIRAALEAWRTAERHWESRPGTGPDDRSAAIDVVEAWLAYQELLNDSGSFVLVVDDEGRCVAASEGIRDALGYEPADVLGNAIESIVPPDLAITAAQAWPGFLRNGRGDGDFRLRAQDGREVSIRYEARAHQPIPGYHSSRSWPIERVRTGG
jgi:PAS domain S-box-containing protein